MFVGLNGMMIHEIEITQYEYAKNKRNTTVLTDRIMCRIQEASEQQQVVNGALGEYRFAVVYSTVKPDVNENDVIQLTGRLVNGVVVPVTDGVKLQVSGTTNFDQMQELYRTRCDYIGNREGN